MAAIPAATLILVRERTAGPPELLMVERSAAMAFAPGALVFPGGRVDPADTTLAAKLGHSDGGASVAAIRETLEECGVAAGLNPRPTPAQSHAMQDALLAGESFSVLLEAAGLELNVTGLTPFARWVAPEAVSRRFDTLFLLAKATEEAMPRAGSGECMSAGWVTADQVLDAESEGCAKLIYP
ncbi:MAG TPA: NUDIX domain-containing protein, partial [Devosia sp.]